MSIGYGNINRKIYQHQKHTKKKTHETTAPLKLFCFLLFNVILASFRVYSSHWHTNVSWYIFRGDSRICWYALILERIIPELVNHHKIKLNWVFSFQNLIRVIRAVVEGAKRGCDTTAHWQFWAFFRCCFSSMLPACLLIFPIFHRIRTKRYLCVCVCVSGGVVGMTSKLILFSLIFLHRLLPCASFDSSAWIPINRKYFLRQTQTTMLRYQLNDKMKRNENKKLKTNTLRQTSLSLSLAHTLLWPHLYDERWETRQLWLFYSFTPQYNIRK